MTIRTLLPIALLALALAACGAPTTPPADGPATTDGSRYTREGNPEVLALAIGFPDATTATVTGDAVAPAEVSELYEGLFVGPFAVEVDGAFAVEFPAADEMPAAALTPLDEAFFFNLSSVACAPTVEPLAAMATPSIFLGFGIPGMVALTVEGPYITIASDVEIPDGTLLDDFAGSIYTWLFVDRDATLVSGEACASYDVDLDLAAGWNQIAWTFGGAADITARVVAPSDFVVAAAQLLEPAPSEPVPPEIILASPSVGYLPLR